ncbi:MAG: cytochrome c3 family protein [Bacteroidota bacterium]
MRSVFGKRMLCVLSGLFFCTINLPAQTNDDCLMCHEDASMTTTWQGKTISLFVNKNVLATSVHKNLLCSKCHTDAVVAEFPHPENLRKVECGTCHSTALVQYSAGVHGQASKLNSHYAPTCKDCHGTHDIKSKAQAESPISSTSIPDLCGECHEEITKEYKESIHWMAVKKGLDQAPSCIGCHSGHSIDAIDTVNKRDAIKKLLKETCLECHQNLLLSKSYGIAGKNAKSYSSHWLAVVRGDTNFAFCIDCHGVHNILPKYHKDSTFIPNKVTATCKKCHPGATETLASSNSNDNDKETLEGYIEGNIKTIGFWLIIILVGSVIIFIVIRMIFSKIKNKKDKNTVNDNE